MHVPTRDRGSGLDFNITPLIDIVFLLIIFFLVATHVVKNEAKTEVDLPTAAATSDGDESPRRIVLTVTRDGEYLISDRPTELSEVEDRITAGGSEFGNGFEVRIRADRAVSYRTLEPVMTACAQSGVTRIRFAVRKAG